MPYIPTDNNLNCIKDYSLLITEVEARSIYKTYNESPYCPSSVMFDMEYRIQKLKDEGKWSDKDQSKWDKIKSRWEEKPTTWVI